MEELNLVALLPYVFVTTFTPGPNNISSAANAARWGLSRTWGYLFGVVSGFFVIMSLCGIVSGALMAALPWLERYMRWVGAAYILWLAYGLVKSDGHGGIEGEGSLRGFAMGFVLQFVNPKVILYGVTLYTAFLSPILARPVPVLLVTALLSVIGFASILSWAVFGAGIDRFLRSPAHRKVLNAVFALLLVYTAATVAEII